MCNCIFTFVNNKKDYDSLKNKKITFLFSNKFYGQNCFVLDKAINFFDCFIHFYKENKFKNYIFFNSKGLLKCEPDTLFLDNNFYLNYYNENIYFLKYNFYLYKIYNLFESNIESHNLINFLSDYHSSFDYQINKNLFDKFIFPRRKILYNTQKIKSIL